jgi:CRISPR/Cas system-associated exonuclease Cas4 (RecB family)
MARYSLLHKILYDYSTFVNHTRVQMESVPFLKEIATVLLQPGAYNLSETCVVFPNKRARLYLSKYMGEITDKPVWAPQYFTISELMEKASGYLYADRLTLLFELYKVYGETAGTRESFDSFYPYSETLLADFDEIDKYLVNAADLFGNLSGLKSIDGRFNYLTEDQIALIRRFWSTFDPENVSEGQKTFLSLWEALPVIYREFRNRLHDQNLAYEGMAYRRAIENFEENMAISGLEDRKYLFIGFNALNACEERLFGYMKKAGCAEFFWDYDTWYTNNDIHEAGFFIRRNLRNFPQIRAVQRDNLLRFPRKVFFVPVPSNTGQAGALSYIFNTLGINEKKDKEKTAVVLADENLLIPVLYAIPGDVTEVNVTMGYPVAGSAVFNLVDSLYELHRNSKKGSAGTAWYFRDVLTVLGNPLLKTLYPDLPESVRHRIIEHNLVYLEETDIFQDQRKDLIFTTLSDNTNACQYLLDIMAMLLRHLAVQQEDHNRSPENLQLEILFQSYTFLTRLLDTMTSQTLLPGTETLFKLIRKMMRTMHLPFSGEPLAGLQVLGLLETRTLDFDHIILLSANEGILPRAADIPSYIPISLRAGFNLPTPEHFDSIYAYYFYRLIQRAKNVALVYDSGTGGLRTGERSRFLHQLHYEMNLPITEITPSSSIAQIPVQPIRIDKTGDVAVALAKYAIKDGRLLSPSSINEFLNCPLKFYFHQIAGLPQPEEVAEEIDARIFGNLLHKAMKIIYTGFDQLQVTREKLESLLKEDHLIDLALDKAFSEELFGSQENTGNRKVEGYNLIIRQVIRTYMYQLIRSELESTPFLIKSLEKKFAASIPVVVEGKTIELQVGGIIDRIDMRQNNLIIIDYKTGSVKNTFSSVESLFDAGEQLRNDAVFQVLLYACIVDLVHPGNTVVPGLYFIRDSHSGDFSYSILQGAKKTAVTSYATVKEEFETLLHHHLTRLFNTREPFTQTTNLKVCTYCAYSGICRR